MKQLLLVIVLTTIHLTGYSQKKFKQVECLNKVCVLYKWAKNPDGKSELQIKFKNKSKLHQVVNLELGLYESGILVEQSDISACLGKNIFSNALQDIHILSSEYIETLDYNKNAIEIKTLSFEMEKTENCE